MMIDNKRSYPEQLNIRYGWPLKIHTRGYDAYLVDIQPLTDGKVAAIYRFPRNDSVVFDDEIRAGLAKDGYDSFEKGYVTLDDLKDCLWEEAGIRLEKK